MCHEGLPLALSPDGGSFASRSMLSGLLYVLQSLVGVSVWSLTQRLVHVLALRLNSLSSWGVGNLGALFNQSMLMGSELSKGCNCSCSSSGDCPMMLFSDEFLRF
ncbi:hypothetical protein F2Q69_00007826 [Brassica cretica]|uniref:Uncharacterized protein n=1 Tax=Brassica cretica TaxID=69181 RepID=A0A8S9P733_BRACR|nr:hypothetical protein F2Q69_00007826 [Brassica cretica]